MTDNAFTGNIFVGNWSGTQESYALGVGPVAYAQGGLALVDPTCTHNMYFNYSGGLLNTNGNGFDDASPITGQDPLISGVTYDLASNSPAFVAPVKFPVIVGGWGPPGYVIPQSGTPPSYTESP